MTAEPPGPAHVTRRALDRDSRTISYLDSRRHVDGPWRYEPVEGGHRLPLEQPERSVALAQSQRAQPQAG